MYLEILKKFIILLNFITLDSILYSNYSLYTMDSPLFTANAHVIRIILIDSGSKGKCIKSREFRESFLFMYIHSRYWLVRACTSNLSHSTWSKSSVAELTLITTVNIYNTNCYFYSQTYKFNIWSNIISYIWIFLYISPFYFFFFFWSPRVVKKCEI